MPKVIIDCDPGIDDAVALLYAFAHLDVIGITTVCGNIDVSQSTVNVLKVLELVGKQLPVAIGAHRPWVSPPRHARDIHGDSGLDGVDLPEPTLKPIDLTAVEFIVSTAREYQDLVIVTLGPLTNLATALRYDPSLIDRLKSIVIMGGSTTHGNITPVAEFNIYSDPEAAQAVFTSGARIYMTGLNVTERMIVDRLHVERLQAGGKVARTIARMLQHQSRVMRERFGIKGAVLHDPCALAPLLRPDLVTFQSTPVAVELASTITRGMTVCDLRAERTDDEKIESDTYVAVDVDHLALMDHIIDTIMQYP